MKRDDFPDSIWDIDPKAGEEHEYEEFEALFQDAWEHSSYFRPPVKRIRPYLQRYFRFRVIPPWVATYINEVLKGDAMENMANAPLDPAIDLRRFPWRLMIGLAIPTVGGFGSPGDGRLEA